MVLMCGVVDRGGIPVGIQLTSPAGSRLCEKHKGWDDILSLFGGRVSESGNLV